MSTGRVLFALHVSKFLSFASLHLWLLHMQSNLNRIRQWLLHSGKPEMCKFVRSCKFCAKNLQKAITLWVCGCLFSLFVWHSTGIWNSKSKMQKCFWCNFLEISLGYILNYFYVKVVNWSLMDNPNVREINFKFYWKYRSWEINFQTKLKSSMHFNEFRHRFFMNWQFILRIISS